MPKIVSAGDLTGGHYEKHLLHVFQSQESASLIYYCLSEAYIN